MPSTIDDVETFLHRAESVAAPIEEFPTLTENVVKTVVSSGVGLLSSGAGAAEEAATSLGADALEGVVLAIADVSGLLIVFATKIIGDFIIRSLGRIPGPVGAYFKHNADNLLGPSEVQTKIVNRLGTNAHKFALNFAQAGRILQQLLAPFYGPVAPSHGSFPDAHNFSELNQEVNYIQWEIGQIKAQLSTAHVPNSVTNIVNPQIWPELHAAQAEIAKLQSAVSHAYSAINAQAAHISSLEHQLVNLSAEIHDVRSVAAGWQDIQRQIETHVTTLTSDYNKASQRISNNTRSIAQLAPLALLLRAGPIGLRNLRKLEDNPCQCPKFGGIPNELGTALAVQLFIENG